jgi:hypothetical protein
MQHCCSVATMDSLATCLASGRWANGPPGLPEPMTEGLMLYTIISEDVARASSVSGMVPTEVGPLVLHSWRGVLKPCRCAACCSVAGFEFHT